jgi:hypothetical protein
MLFFLQTERGWGTGELRVCGVEHAVEHAVIHKKNKNKNK